MVDGVLGTQTRGGRMEGADKSTELWRHPNQNSKFGLPKFKLNLQLHPFGSSVTLVSLSLVTSKETASLGQNDTAMS